MVRAFAFAGRCATEVILCGKIIANGFRTRRNYSCGVSPLREIVPVGPSSASNGF